MASHEQASFENQWADLKSSAKPEPPTAMHLNSGGPGSNDPGDPLNLPGPNDGMSSDPEAKRKAAKYLAEELAPDTKSAGVVAGAATQTVTGTAPAGRSAIGVPYTSGSGPNVDTFLPGYVSGAGEFKGWVIKSALDHAMTKWGDQMNNLMGRLLGEVEALGAAKNLYANQDFLAKSGLAPLGEGDPLLRRVPDGSPDITMAPDSPLVSNPASRSRISDY